MSTLRLLPLIVAVSSVTAGFGIAADVPALVPLPAHVQASEGTYAVTAATALRVDVPGNEADDAVRCLTDRLGAAAGIKLALAKGQPAGESAGAILLTTRDADASLGDEGYALDVTANGITIRAPKAAGLFYGVQTLLQMMPPSIYAATASQTPLAVPCVKITDQPRFKWRGLMLDVCRHFMPKPAVLRLLDEMAMHKLNVFHFHLSDDQGWRIEIKKYPRLTSVAAWRDNPGFGMDPKLSDTFNAQGKYGGFYTQDDVREIVAYATARHITVVPEIEMPGHATAALRAYPEFGTPAEPSTDVKGDAGIFHGIFDPSKEETFTFLQDVLGEVIELFPSPFIHIGGDETPKGPWLADPKVVAFMKDKGLAEGEQLQSYVIKRVDQFITSKGRRLIGFDEILEGGLPPGAAVTSWRGIEGGLTAAKAGHDVVMVPNQFCYLDYEQGTNTEPHERGTVLTVKKVYDYEPIPEGLAADQSHHVLGVQGNLWTEYVPNFSWAEYLFWPRGAAIAESGWTAAAARNYDDFARRQLANEKRYDAMGMNYRPAETDALANAITLKDGKLVIDNPVEGATVHYTVDGSVPTESSLLYTGPAALPMGWVQVTARYFVPGKVAKPAAAAQFLDGRAVDLTTTATKDWETRESYFYTARFGGGPDERVTVTFDAGPQALRTITVVTGTEASPESKAKEGAIETSADGKTFTPAATFAADGTARADVAGQPIAAFRIRFTKAQTPRPIVRSVAIE